MLTHVKCNDEVRLALDGGTATTDRLFVEPFDTAQSQVYIMITNAAGEQFPMETIDRVAAWMKLGAPYFGADSAVLDFSAGGDVSGTVFARRNDGRIRVLALLPLLALGLLRRRKTV